MPTFAILCGLPGSGKSTLGRKLKTDRGFFVVSTDTIRLALNANVYPRAAEYDALEPVVWELARVAVKHLLAAGHDVAVDATHLTRERRRMWRELARVASPGVRVEIHWCVGAWDSAERWATERGHTAEEYQEIRRRLEASVEVPTANEADEVVVHGQL